MKPRQTFALTFLIILLVTSCEGNKNTTVIGSGDVIYMDLEVPAFTGVSVTGECNVKVRLGNTQSVEIGAQKEVLNAMTYEVKNKTLQIGFRNGTTVNTDKPITADIVIPALSYVAVTGAGDFDLAGNNQDYLHIYITGSGNVSAFDLPVDECLIQITGAGNCNVHVKEILTVQVSGVGNIFYKGSPTLVSDISGVGNVTAVPD